MSCEVRTLTLLRKSLLRLVNSFFFVDKNEIESRVDITAPVQHLDRTFPGIRYFYFQLLISFSPSELPHTHTQAFTKPCFVKRTFLKCASQQQLKQRGSGLFLLSHFHSHQRVSEPAKRRNQRVLGPPCGLPLVGRARTASRRPGLTLNRCSDHLSWLEGMWRSSSSANKFPSKR